MDSNNTARNFGYYAIIALSTILILGSLASLVYNIPKWYLKVLDFPRLQQFILGVILIVAFVLINHKWKFPAIALTVGLLTSIIIHFSFISPYVVGSEVVPSANSSEVNSENTVGILIANVLIENKKSEKFKEILAENDPEMILAMEVDSWWVDQLAYLKQNYPYSIERPLDNAYGMSLYSKYPLSETEVLYLSHSKVPSFNTTVRLPSGKKFRFHGVHPVAPFPSDKYPENIGEQGEDQKKEVELAKIGNIVAKNDLPSIVAGDFNDVAWSNTSRLFGKSGNLKDTRIGRGLYNTFDAESLIMRWPLDHFFVSKEFAVLDFKRLPKFHSDHFPLYAKFVIK